MAKSRQANSAAGAAKWARRLQSSGDDIRAGVEGVTVSPGAAAAAAKDTWLANLNASADRWANSMRNLTLDSWKSSMINKGVSRIIAGAATAQPKMERFLQEWIQYEDQVVSQLGPRGTLEDNIARSAAVQRANAQAKGKFRQAGRSK